MSKILLNKPPLLVVGVAALLALAGIGLWLGVFRGSAAPIVSAQEACDLMDVSYDTLLTYEHEGEAWRTEIRTSGDDYHKESTRTSIATDELVQKGEEILKDGTVYSRNSVGGAPNVYGPWRVVGTDMPGNPALPCLDVSTYDARRSANGDPHYTTANRISDVHGEYVSEFWADSAGRPIRGRRSFYLPDDSSDSSSGARSSDSTPVPPPPTLIVDFTYSGFGEANVITAPTLPGAPTPTPTT